MKRLEERRAAGSDGRIRDKDATCGTGRCSRCSCMKFGGHGQICEQCGHRYDDHDTGWLRAEGRGEAIASRRPFEPAEA